MSENMSHVKKGEPLQAPLISSAICEFQKD